MDDLSGADFRESRARLIAEDDAIILNVIAEGLNLRAGNRRLRVIDCERAVIAVDEVHYEIQRVLILNNI